LNNELDLKSKIFLDLVSANVTKARIANGYSQLKLATEMGYSSASYYGRIELRKNNEHFNLVQLYKISQILEIPIETFFKQQD